MKHKYVFYRQYDEMDCGPTCLRMVSKFFGRHYSRDFIAENCHISKEGVSMGGLAEGAEAIGLHSMVVSTDIKTLTEEAPLPCIAHWRQRHYVVVYEAKKKNGHYILTVADPAYGLVTYTEEEFKRGWLSSKVNKEADEGILLLLEPTPEFFHAGDMPDPKKKTFGLLLEYLRPHKRTVLQLMFGLIAGSIIQLIFPFLTQSIVDYGINYQDINFIYLILLAQLTLFASEATVQVIRGWLLLQMTNRINIRLISNFLIKLMKLPIAFFDSKNIGDLIQRIDDHRRIQNFLSTATLNVAFSVFNILLFGIILLVYNVTIFLVFFTGAVLYLVWALMFMKKRSELDFKRFDASSGNQSSIYQLINGMQEIKLNGSQKRRRWEWEAIQVKLFRISVKGLSIAQMQVTGSSVINELKNILISFLAARAVMQGDMTLGMMLSVQYIIGQLNLPINNLISFIQTTQDARLSLERIGEIHSKADEDQQSANLQKNLPADRSIYIDNLSFRYGAATSALVLNNIGLHIPEGQVTAIVGASGSGKTTLIKLLLKFYNNYEGKILVGSNSLNNFSPSFWRSKCGCVMQDGFIFSDSIARNITESDSDGLIDKEKLQRAARIANLEEFVESLPAGYNTRVGASGMNLSGGQKQRILIARAVYKDPEYILLDEATSSLDANNEKIIMNNLSEFFRGKTVIIVAHRLSTVKNADRIIVLEKGNIVEFGKHTDLTVKKGIYYSLVKNQLELGN